MPSIKDRKSSSFFPPSFKAEAKDRIEEEEEEEVEREDDEDEELLLDEELELELEREDDEDEELLLDEELLPMLFLFLVLDLATFFFSGGSAPFLLEHPSQRFLTLLLFISHREQVQELIV